MTEKEVQEGIANELTRVRTMYLDGLITLTEWLKKTAMIAMRELERKDVS